MQIKTEHDGLRWERTRVGMLKTKDLEHENEFTIRDLKVKYNNYMATKYHLFLQNCHFYGKDIYKTLKNG